MISSASVSERVHEVDGEEEKNALPDGRATVTVAPL